MLLYQKHELSLETLWQMYLYFGLIIKAYLKFTFCKKNLNFNVLKINILIQQVQFNF